MVIYITSKLNTKQFKHLNILKINTMKKVSLTPSAIVFSANQIIVIEIILDKVLEETKKLAKVSERFKPEIETILGMQKELPAEMTPGQTTLFARGCELAEKSARKLKSIESARFKKEIETINELRSMFGIAIPEPVKRVKKVASEGSETDQAEASEQVQAPVKKVAEIMEAI